ncbi:MAG: aldose 1-epimerase [Thermoleophilaceae bacterium]|nr:aldose 1-epimerase [Thermoleophilaceae bacterium]
MAGVAAAVEEITREGYPALRLSAGDLAATFVPQLGMIGASLTHRGEELLGQRKGLPAYEATGSTMGIPFLHPWANRLSGLTYDACGRTVTIDPDSPLVRLDPNGLPIHGLLNASPHWRVDVAGGELTAHLDFGAHPELLEAFPFPHDVSHRIRLDAETGLSIETTVHANAGSPVPVSFGFHPYLTLPGTPREEWQVELPVEEHLILDERGIPTGAAEPPGETSGPLGAHTYDDGYKGIHGPFALADATRRIEVTFERGYPYVQVFAPEGQALICFEPMTAATNALVAGTCEVLQPGDSLAAAFRIAPSDA